MFEKLNLIADRLRDRGFDAAVFKSAEDAVGFILSDMPKGKTIAIGGSMTVKQMDLHTKLRAQGHTVLWHWEAAPADRPALLHEAMNAPVYLCSANALDADDPVPPKPEEDTDNTLEFGDKGDKVTALQIRLAALGYYTSKIDGKFGSGTRTAVRLFQARNGLAVDGKVGPRTQVKLDSTDAVPAENGSGSLVVVPTVAE